MTLRMRTAILVTALLALALPSVAWSMEWDDASVRGLWRLMGTMPAGVPSEETPDKLAGYRCYWFLSDGTVTLLNDTGEHSTRTNGVWRRKGRELMITWDSGKHLRIRVVRSEKNSMILSGFDVRPLWYRFSKLF
jgi:hypothetical protein